MSQTLIRDGHNSADSGLRHNAVVRSLSASALFKPALVLVFLLSATGSVLAVSAGNTSSGTSKVPAVIQDEKEPQNLNATAENEANAETDKDATSEATTDETASNTNSVKVESVTNNGVSNTRVEVNGQEIPVRPNSTTTQVDLQNGSQSVTSITTQNTQMNNNGSTFNNTISSSFSHNFSSQTVVGGD